MSDIESGSESEVELHPFVEDNIHAFDRLVELQDEIKNAQATLSALKKEQKEIEEELLATNEKGKSIEMKDKIKLNYPQNSKKIEEIDKFNRPSIKEIQNNKNNLYNTSPLNVLPHISMQKFNDPKFQRIIKYEGRNFDPIKFALFSSTVVIVTFFSLLRGSKELKSIIGIEFCGSMFWFTLVVMVGAVICIGYYSTNLVMREIRIKKENNYLMPHEMIYDKKNIIFLNTFMFFFGIIANILGLGGGMFIYPMFTTLGMQPLIVSSTSLFMILLSKIFAVILNYISNLVIPGLSIYFAILMTLAGFFISNKVSQIIATYNRQSLITAIMVFILAISLITSPLYAYFVGSKSPNFWKFSSYC